MKTSPVFILGIGLLLSVTAGAQIPNRPAGWQSLKVIESVEPIFPYHLTQVGVTKGEARVAISTNAEGKLEEYLVIAYTDKLFADSAVAAIKEWTFEPARLHGEPVATRAELIFYFEARGTVASSATVADFLEAQVRRIMDGRYVYHPCTLQELDRIPLPLVTVTPQYSTQLAEKGVKGRVTIEFFIDETGAVRMPTGSAEDNSQLTSLAINALSQWRFEPPTSKGRTVLVRASQVFNFENRG
jgi:TonB family protein